VLEMKKRTKNTQLTKARKKTESIKLDTKNKKVQDVTKDTKIELKKIPIIKGVFDIFGMWKAFKVKSTPQKRLLVNFEYYNGQHTSFYVILENDFFKFANKLYIIDTQFMYYNTNLKENMLDYHEGISIPIQRKITPEQIKKAVAKMQQENSVSVDAYESLNPKNLAQWQKSSIIQKIVEGADLDKALRFLKMMSIFILVIVLIIFAVLGDYTGLFNSINVI
jgi:hypothetical protein